MQMSFGLNHKVTCSGPLNWQSRIAISNFQLIIAIVDSQFSLLWKDFSWWLTSGMLDREWGGRVDDNLESIRKRFATYEKDSFPSGQFLESLKQLLDRTGWQDAGAFKNLSFSLAKLEHPGKKSRDRVSWMECYRYYYLLGWPKMLQTLPLCLRWPGNGFGQFDLWRLKN